MMTVQQDKAEQKVIDLFMSGDPSQRHIGYQLGKKQFGWKKKDFAYQVFCRCVRISLVETTKQNVWDTEPIGYSLEFNVFFPSAISTGDFDSLCVHVKLHYVFDIELPCFGNASIFNLMYFVDGLYEKELDWEAKTGDALTILNFVFAEFMKIWNKFYKIKKQEFCF